MSAASLAAELTSPASGVTLVRLTGTIDADFPRDQLLELEGVVLLDLDGVTRVTSYGVPEWLATIEALECSFLGLLRCRPAIVAQLNTVAGFVGRGEVLSLYLPYVCERCEQEQQVLVSSAEAKKELRRGGPRPRPCSRCGETAELDDVPSAYLSFVAGRPDPAPPRAVGRLLGLLGSGGGELSLKKEVEGNVTALWLSGFVDRRLRTKRVLDGIEGHVVVVCAGVSGMDATGAERLHELARRSNAYFARVPVELLTGASEEERRVFRARVLSVLLATPRRRALELDAGSLGPPGECDEGDPATQCLSTEARALLRESLAEEWPPELNDYLRERRGEEPTPPDSRAAPSNGRIGGKYRVVRRIGQGGMAEVLLAEMLGPGGFKKRVVVKKLLPELVRDPDLKEMFLREARLAARVSHPNVVQVHDLGRDGRDYFIAMEYVRGWDLRGILRYSRRLKRPIPVELCCRIISDVASGLHAAHSARGPGGVPLEIIHRDVSPDNVLLSVQGAVKVTDFGISKPVGQNLGTRPGTVRGKVIYLSPEQLDGSLGAVDRRVDVYAAGLVLHECLTGASALWRSDEVASMRAALAGEIPPVAEQRPDVPEALAEVVRIATARRPDDRYPTARHLQLALERVILDIGQAASSAHLAHWLHSLARQGYAQGEIRSLDFTPPYGALVPDDEGADELGRTRTLVDDTLARWVTMPEKEDS